MFKNYIIAAFRSIVKNRGTFLINVIGMGLSLSFSLLILVYLYNENSYEVNHENKDRIYRLSVNTEVEGNVTRWATNAPSVAPAMQNQIPEIVDYVRLKNDVGVAILDTENTFDIEVDKLLTADASFFRIFTFPVIAGDLDPLDEPNSIVLTKDLAERIFGQTNAVGQTLTVNKSLDLQVTAIVDNPPSNTHIKFNALMSWSTFPDQEIWDDAHAYTYLLLPEDHDEDVFRDKVENFIDDNLNIQAVSERMGMELTMEVQELEDIYLNSNKNSELVSNSSTRYLTTFLCIALFFIISASFNYVNISVASSMLRSKEVGIRKVLGAFSNQIRNQYLLESFIVTAISFMVGIVITALLFNQFSDLIDKELDISLLLDYRLILIFILLLIVIAFFAGIYPALYLSKFNPIAVLRSQGAVKNRKFMINKVMLVVQLGLTITMIIGSGVITSQLSFIQTADVGFVRENIVMVDLPFSRNREFFKQDIQKIPEVKKVSIGSFHPLSSVKDEHLVEGSTGEMKTATIKKIYIDHEFIDLMGIGMDEGRGFDTNLSTDESGSVLVNESFVNYFNLEDPIGNKVNAINFNKRSEIVGVVKNANLYSLHNSVQPMIINLSSKPYQSGDYMYIKIIPGQFDQFVKKLDNSYSAAFGDLPLRWYLLEDEYNKLYSADQRIGRLLKIGVMAMIVLACMGLYGLSNFFAIQESKFIGIRKVLGASYKNIFLHHTKSFILLVLIASLISWPISYYMMNLWLQSFVLQVNFGFLLMIISSILTLLIVIVITTVHALRLIRLNPVEVIRK